MFGLTKVGTLEIDESRSSATYVVLESKLTCPRDGEKSTGGYGIGLLVTARRMVNESSPYQGQDNGEVITFRMSGPFENLIVRDEILVVGFRNLAIHR